MSCQDWYQYASFVSTDISPNSDWCQSEISNSAAMRSRLSAWSCHLPRYLEPMICPWTRYVHSHDHWIRANKRGNFLASFKKHLLYLWMYPSSSARNLAQENYLSSCARDTLLPPTVMHSIRIFSERIKQTRTQYKNKSNSWVHAPLAQNQIVCTIEILKRYTWSWLALPPCRSKSCICEGNAALLIFFITH